MIKLKVIANLYEADGRYEIKAKYRKGMTLADYLADLKDIPTLSVHLDGVEIPRDEWPGHLPKNGSEYVCICNVEYEWLAGIIVTAFASLVNAGVISANVAWIAALAISYVVVGAVLWGVSTLINMLTTSAPNAPGGGGMNSSPTYGWDGAKLSTRVGAPIQVAYGENRVSGQLINFKTEYDGDKVYLELLISLGHGPSEAISDIEIEGNPIENYRQVTYETRLGTDDQSPIHGFNEVVVMNPQSVELTHDGFVYTTDKDDVEAFRANIYLPALYHSAMGIRPYSVDYSIEWRIHGSSDDWASSGVLTIDGKTTSPIRRQWRPKNPDGSPLVLTAAKYDIRFKRVTVDPPTAEHVNSIFLAGVDEITYDDIAYQGLTLLAVRALATDQLSNNIPNVTCIHKARKVKTYDGAAWSDPVYTRNPAWINYDIFTSKDVGLGQFIDESQCNLDGFYSFAQHCDEAMGDGSPRYCLDIIADADTEAWTMVTQAFAGSQAVPLLAGNKWTVLMERPSTPIQLFTMGNIKYGSVKGWFTDLDQQFNAVRVEYLNKANKYNRESITIVADGVPVDKVNCRDISLFGVTSTAQAIRVGRRILNQGLYMNENLSFETGITGIGIQPGDVFNFSHDVPQWGYSGCVNRAASNTDLEVDFIIPAMGGGKFYNLLIQDMTDDAMDEVGVASLEYTALGCTRLKLINPLAFIPATGDICTFGEVNRAYKPYRCMDMERTPDNDIKITSIEYNESVYNDTSDAVPVDDISDLPDLWSAPNFVENITLTDGIRKQGDGAIVTFLDICFTRPDDPRYGAGQIYLSSDGGSSWDLAGETTTEYFRVEGMQDGDVTMVKVVSKNLRSSKTSPFTGSPTATITIQGKQTPPPDVIGFTAASQSATIMLDWVPVDVPDLRGYEVREGVEWGTGAPVQVLYSGSHYEFETTVSGTHYYMMKAVDTSGNYSQNPASATVDVTIDTDGVTILTSDELTATGGTGAGVTQYPDILQMILDTVAKYDTGEHYDSGLKYDIPTVANGTWTTSEKDIGGVFTVKTAVDMAKTANLSVSYEICYKNTLGDAYSAWEALTGDTRSFRYFKLRATFTTSDTTKDAVATQFLIRVLAPTFSHFSNTDVIVAIGGTRINYPQAFSQKPSLSYAAISNAGFRGANVTAQDVSGFNVKVYDAAGTDVGGTINWRAEGV
jgi:predicted phage tail protein